MRILRFFVWSAIFLGIVSIISFFIGREILLWWGINRIETALTSMQSVQVQETYLEQCSKRGSAITATGAAGEFQLRFVDSSTYHLEVVCNSFSFDPITISKHELPMFITKYPGTSGISLGKGGSVALASFAPQMESLRELGMRKYAIDILTQTWSTTWDGTSFKQSSLPDITYGAGPTSTCTSFGYYCCQEQSEMGTGSQLLGTSDCEKTCFAKCSNRPIILSVTTNPFFESLTRQLVVRAGEEIILGAVIDPGIKGPVDVLVNFGDGTQESFATSTIETTHTYTCPTSAECSYNFSITATNQAGSVSAKTPTSQLTVVVSP